MKNFIFLTCLLYAYYSNAQKPKTDWAKLKLLGSVKSISESRFDSVEKSGEFQKGDLLVSFQYLFNHNGNLIEENGGANAHKMIYEYDVNGNLAEMTDYNENGSVVQKMIYKYDNKANLIEKRDDNSKMYDYDEGGSVDVKWIYKYDVNGNLIEEIDYDQRGKLMAKTTKKYDIIGNLIEELSYDGARPINKGTYKYVARKLIEQNDYSIIDRNLINKSSKKYDVNGNLVEQYDYSTDSKLINKRTYKYDINKNLIEQYSYDGNGILAVKWTYRYEFDKNSNWIKKYELESSQVMGNSKLAYERIIEYFSNEQTLINNSNKIELTTGYNYAGHSDFKIFWGDFKKAINTGDKDAVAKMTNFPFKDYTGEALYKYLPEEGKALTSNSVDEFKANYDKIFVPELVRLINSNKYRGWDKTKDKTDRLGKVIKMGEYLLPGINYTEGFNFFEGGLAFSKIGGIFKLFYIPFYHNPDEGN